MIVNRFVPQPAEVERFVRTRLARLRRSGDEWRGPCPVHGGQRDSFALNTKSGQAYCHSACNRGWDLVSLEAALSGTDFRAALREVRSIVGRCESQNRNGSSVKTIEATYDYTDTNGNLLFQVVRFRPKDFRQRRPDGQGGWTWDLKGTTPVLYNMTGIAKASGGDLLLICEGEKDVEVATHLGLLATCNPMGAGKWRDAYSADILHLRPVILPDNDHTGREHAVGVAGSLLRAGCPEVGVVEVHYGKDLADYVLVHGHSGDEVQNLMSGADWFTANTYPSLQRRWSQSPNASSATSEEDKPSQAGSSQAILTGDHSEASRLVDLVRESAELFRSHDGKAYASILVRGHREALPVKSSMFKDYISYLYHREYNKSPSDKGIKAAQNTIAGRAIHDGEIHRVFCRVGEHDDAVYVDLITPDRAAVEITPEGWRVMGEPPVRFRRPQGMLGLPRPEPGGSGREILARFLNLQSSDSLLLALAWVLAALRPRGPYPVLIASSEAGSGKSTLCKMLRSLIDPNVAAVRSQPKDIRDLSIAASNSAVLAFDNLSYVEEWLGDAICRLATGGGFATRRLHTDDEEALFNLQRPVMMNGIEEMANRADLMDRAIVLELPPIGPNARIPEKQLWEDFERHLPQMLGYVFDGLSGALANLPHVHLASSPRMADFAALGVAAEVPLGWKEGDFLRAYEANRANLNELAIDASPIGRHVLAIAEMPRTGPWSGTATVLLEEILKRANDSEKRLSSFPKSARGLTNALKRITPNLRKAGVVIEYDRDSSRNRDRIIRLIVKD